jgi:hypothetical protein
MNNNLVNYTKDINLKRRKSHGRAGNPSRTVLVRLATLLDHKISSQAIEKYYSLYEHWKNNEGKRSALLRAKAISHIVLNNVLAQPLPVYPFLATTQGWPRCIIDLRRERWTPQSICALLTVLGFWRAELAPGIPDLSSITDDGPDIPEALRKEFTEVIPKKFRFDPQELSPCSLMWRTTQGPNGQSLRTCLLDLHALKEEGLLPILEEYANLTNSDQLLDNLELWEEFELDSKVIKQYPNLVSSRLSIKRERGGKDRVFAMIDYWSQIALKPLHNLISSYLTKFQGDCTWNQDKGCEKVRTWTMEEVPLFSFDLSSATDRFPRQLQEAVLEKMTSSSEFSTTWGKLMAHRDFYYKGSKYRYARGQPMGAYSSWPIFAFTHHITVMVAAKRARIANPEYVLLGDDIVIRGEDLAKQYESLIAELGVKISFQKSLLGSHRAEFCKKIYYQGHEVSALQATLVKSCLSNKLDLLTLYQRLLRSTTEVGTTNPAPSTVFLCFKGFIPEKWLKDAENALWVTTLLDKSSEGSRVTPPPSSREEEVTCDSPKMIKASEAWTIFTLVKYKYLARRYQDQMSQLTLSSKDKLNSLELPGVDSRSRQYHPVYESFEQKISQSAKLAKQSLGKLWTAFTKQDGLDSTLASPALSLPDVRDLNPKHLSKRRGEMTVLLLTYQALSNFQSKRRVKPQLTVVEFVKALNG